jgi:hypothetical protein
VFVVRLLKSTQTPYILALGEGANIGAPNEFSVTVPEQVAVPLVHTAVVGAPAHDVPLFVMFILPKETAPEYTVIVAVTPEQELLKEPSVTFPVPLKVPPLT